MPVQQKVKFQTHTEYEHEKDGGEEGNPFLSSLPSPIIALLPSFSYDKHHVCLFP
jgi:hypothetical protein